jgi:putative hemolysin
MEKFVDVKRLIISKNKNLLKWIPGFVVRWIERVIHQDEVNDFMTRQKGKDSFGFSQGVVEEFNLTLNLKGIENIPHVDESCIFTSNHPLGGLDAISIIHLFREVRPDIKFIVNDLLMSVQNLKDKFIGVNLVGKNAVQSLQKVEEQFASDSATFLFPAGLVSRKIDGSVEDLEWKKTFISKSRKYKKPVVPIHIDGRLTDRFYCLANFRKFLGVKLNIEMFYLVDELYKQKNRTIDIVIGAPIPAEVFTSEKSDKEWAQWVKDKVYELKKA